MKHCATLLAGLIAALGSTAWAAGSAPLVLEAKIPLGSVKGRIDHLAIDVHRRRLFVAELGNNSVGVVDITARKVVQTLAGLSEPQGVGYVPSTDTLYVADAGDGAVHLFRGPGLMPDGRIELGNDADNIRVSGPSDRVFIGYGTGAIAVIDPTSRTRIATIPLPAHPEGFQLDGAAARAFVDLPGARQIATVDIGSVKQTGAASTGPLRSNFPMAIDADAQRVLAVFREPPTLMVLGAQDGKVGASVGTCADADDVFVDPKRAQVYVTCGEGVIDIFARRPGGYERLARVPTASGARTSLFVPEFDRLFVGVRAGHGEPAAVWVFRPASG